MFQKIKQFFVRHLTRKSKRVPEIQAVPTTIVVSNEEPEYTQRISVLCRELKPYRRRMPEVKVLYVQGFPDIQRFLILLCGQNLWDFRYKAKRMYGKADLPNGEGYMILEEKRFSADKGIIAILSVHIPKLTDTVCEVRFKIKKSKINHSKRKTNENYKNRLYRQRSSCTGKRVNTARLSTR